MPITDVGIDVGKETLEVQLRRPCGRIEAFEVPNEPKRYPALIKRLKQARVVMEPTGNYHLKLARALDKADGIEVMLINPRAARDFARAMMKRSKTDKLDAATLLECCRKMDFRAWLAPSPENFELRTMARRIESLISTRTQEKNRLHASEYLDSQTVCHDIKVSIRHFTERVETLRAEALKLIQKSSDLRRQFAHLTSIRGIGEASAIQILGEICILPQDMTPRQWVAHAGLDPRALQSGLSLNAPARISRMGNRHLRNALYMPALVAKRCEPNVRAFYEKLLANQKLRMQAVVAVMRKLLHAIHGMLRTDTDFDGVKFYAGG